jgi:hypothetical protein
MAPRYPTRYTLAEHESIPFSVVAAAIRNQAMEDKVRAHCGVVFDKYMEADAAADRINDETADTKGGIYPDPNNGAHVTGFTNRVKLDGRRMYIPIKTPEGTAQ